MAPNPYENVNAYNRNKVAQTSPNGNSRGTDAWALLVCASRLNDAAAALAQEPLNKTLLKDYGDAIRQNQRLWTLFQVAVVDPENPLPEETKRILLNLSVYVDKTSFRAVGRLEPRMIESLISINRTIASGLSKVAPSQMQQQTATEPAVPGEPISFNTSA